MSFRFINDQAHAFVSHERDVSLKSLHSKPRAAALTLQAPAPPRGHAETGVTPSVSAAAASPSAAALPLDHKLVLVIGAAAADAVDNADAAAHVALQPARRRCT